jgi:hypothetical protein
MTSFIKHLPSKVPGQAVPVLVRKTKREDTRFWDKHVSIHIRACNPLRADHDWRWGRILASAGLIARVLGQEPVGFTLGIEDEERDSFVPCAMAFLAGRFRALDEAQRDAVFLWYLASAPRTFLEQVFLNRPLPRQFPNLISGRSWTARWKSLRRQPDDMGTSIPTTMRRWSISWRRTPRRFLMRKQRGSSQRLHREMLRGRLLLAVIQVL